MSSAMPEKHSLHTMLHVLDNQYVPYDVYLRMGGNSLSNLDRNPELYNSYLKNIDAEFKKTLLFSEAVFVNRAYFVNTPLLTKYILDDAQREPFLELLHRGIIRPVLLNEDGFVASIEKLAFTTSGKKDQILNVYQKKLRNTHEFRYSGIFPGVSPGELIPSRFKEALSDCLRDEAVMTQRCAALRRSVQGVGEENLRKKIRSVAEWAEKTPVVQVTRESVYKNEICEKSSLVADGKYKIDPDVFALKLWVDAMYNDNTAKLCGLKITMPQNVPTSRELGVIWRKSGGFADIPRNMKIGFNEELSHRNSKTISNVLQHLGQNDNPLQISYQDLGLQDIINIRNTPAWKNFIYNLNLYVDFNLAENDFSESLHGFFSGMKKYIGVNHGARPESYFPAAVTVVSAACRTFNVSIILMKVCGHDTILDVECDSALAGAGLLDAVHSVLSMPFISTRIARGVAFVNNRKKRMRIENCFSIDYSTRSLSEPESDWLRQSLRTIREEDCRNLNWMECTSMEE